MITCLVFVFSVGLHPGRIGPLFQGPAGATAPVPPALPQILIFDLPPSLVTGSGVAIQTFLVGYFQGEEDEPRWTLVVARDLARIDEAEGTARIFLPVADVPPGLYAARVKIRTGSGESAWSGPSPLFSAPDLRARRSRPAAARPKATQDFRLEPALAAAVKNLLPGEVEFADASRGFRNAAQFVSALLAARNTGIAFADLKAALVTAPGRVGSLRAAVAKLRPDRDATQEARRALAQARLLIRETRRKREPSADSLCAALAAPRIANRRLSGPAVNDLALVGGAA